MTLHTSLVITGDTSSARAAVDALAGGIDRLEAETRDAAAATAAFDHATDNATAGATRLSRAIAALAASARRASGAIFGVGDGARRASGAIVGVGEGSRLASHHLANLGFQLNDVVVGFASGQRPMAIFMQQGAQIGQIMGQARIGIGGLAREIAAMAGRFAVAHPILTAVAATAAAAAGAISVAARRLSSEHGAELQAYARQLGLTTDEIEQAGGAVVTFGDLVGGLWDTIRDGLGLEDIWSTIAGWVSDAARAVWSAWKEALAQVYAAAAAAADGFKAAWQNIGPIIAEGVIAGVNAAIGAIEHLVNRAIDGLNRLATLTNPMLAAAQMQGVQVGLGHVSFGRVGNPYAGTTSGVLGGVAESYQRHLGEARGAIGGFFDDVERNALARSRARLRAAQGHDGRGGGSGGRGGRAGGRDNLDQFGRNAAGRIQSLVDQFDNTPAQVARVNKALHDLDALMADIADKRPPNFEQLLRQGEQARRIIQDGINKPFNDFIASQRESLQIGALQAQGRDDEAEALQAILHLEKQQGSLQDEQRAKILDNVRALEQQERAIERLHERQQLYLAALDQTKATIADTITQIARGNVGSLLDLPSRIFDTYTDALGRYLADQLTGGAFRELEDRITGRSPAAEAAERVAISFGEVQKSARAAADAFRDVTDAVRGGTVGRAGGATGAAVDQFISLADPAAAAVLGISRARTEKAPLPFAYQTDPRQLFSDLFTTMLSGVVGRQFAGLIGDAVGRGLEGAAIGSAVGSLVGGSRTGAQIGGALGNIVGKEIGPALGKAIGGSLGKAIGSAGGPIGSVIGSIAGSLLGGLFSKTKKASATITSVDQDATVTGNNAKYRSTASGLAGNVQDALSQIAEQLGGGLGNFAVSIGVRKGKYRVDPTGAGRTKAKGGVVDFGEDQAAAIAFAIADAIQDGAVTGLSAAVTRALKSSTDVDKALREALKVDDLETLLSGPAGELAKTFKDFEREAADRLRIARQYGLDVVKTEELNAKQRKEILNQAIKDQVGSLQDLLDDIKYGDLFEGTAVDQRNQLLAQIASAKADAANGVEGASDRLADLSRQLLGLDRDAFGTAGAELAGDRASTISVAEQIIRQETERIKAAQDAQLAANGKLDMSNALASETNDLLAKILGQLRAGGSVVIGAGGSVRRGISTGRAVAV